MKEPMACQVKDLYAGYGDMIVVNGVNIYVKIGEKVALLGPNGSGKTTLINTIAGLLKPFKGEIRLFGYDITGLKPHEIAELGVSIVPEGGRVFPRLTVMENLLVAIPRKGKSYMLIEEIFKLFPVLKERREQLAGTLSGGEQRMLAIARALVRNPKLLIIDELSLGLAPKLVLTLYKALNELWETSRISILVTEQFVKMALEFSHRAYFIELGSIVLEGPSQELIENPYVKRVYLGV